MSRIVVTQTAAACGTGQTAKGPFYCPGDHKVYLDMAFFRETEQRFHAGGDFARAYVIAHEIGHHVQNLTGITKKTDALRAANAIGDDMLQKQSRGVVVPDSCTHGSSAQRMRWFKAGFATGNMRACDRFAARAL